MNTNNALLAAAKLGLQMIEEHGLDTMDGKTTHAAGALRRAIKAAETPRQPRRSKKPLINAAGAAALNGAITEMAQEAATKLQAAADMGGLE